MMRVAILETGAPPVTLQPRFGRYPAMFAELLGAERIAASYDVTAGELPDRPDAHPAYLITGSAAGVHDGLPWIEPLIAFLREARGVAKLIGICFGHQAMAQAFGGEVARAPRGWGVGLHRYDIVQRAAWMDSADPVAVPVSHQDQVLVRPPAATILGASAFTPFAMLAYDDQPAISFQCHPEFVPDYASALITARAAIPDAERAIASLAGPNDCARIGGWLRTFLDQPAPAPAA